MILEGDNGKGREGCEGCEGAEDVSVHGVLPFPLDPRAIVAVVSILLAVSLSKNVTMT